MITSQRNAPGLNVFAAVKRLICCLRLVVTIQLVKVYISDWLLSIRPEPITLLELPIMLLSIIPKTSLLCLKLCLGILSDNVKFNRLN